MSDLAIAITGLRKAFKDHLVLDGLDLAVPRGEVYALLGRNGAGKTTTVSICTTLDTPDAGTVLVAGHDVVRDPAAVRRAITATGQNTSIDAVLTGRENLVLIARLRHLPDPKGLARQMLERFDLVEAGDKPTATYSGGMKRRLDIAMSLVGDPQIVFLDEPTTGLDPAGRREVWATIADLAAGGTTIMLTTQYMDEAAHLATTIGILTAGRIAVSGHHDAILAAAGTTTLEDAFLALTGDEADGTTTDGPEERS